MNMNEALQYLLNRYSCKTEDDYKNALKEIVQEIALLGLWRAKFYEHAAFYGGSALRILHGIDRFSEDLDFSLVSQNAKFKLQKYHSAIKDELSSYGFDVNIVTIEKRKLSAIQSAFIKMGTMQNLVTIGVPENLQRRFQHNQVVSVKFEVDTNPPMGFSTEARTLLLPIPFSVRTYTLPDLFAGKIHAILCRTLKNWVKGRDWYDFVWYVARKTPVNLVHLRNRLLQTEAISEESFFFKDDLIAMLKEKIQKTDFEAAKADVVPLLRNKASVEMWSKTFFDDLVTQIISI